MGVRIVTDSASDTPAELAREFDITVVPVTVYFGEESFRDGVDLTHEEFFRRLTTGSALPRTTQPTVGDFVGAYEALAGEGHDVVSMHVSGKLSGTVNSARNASRELPDARIEVVDTGLASMGMTPALKAAGKAAQRGETAESVAKAGVEAAAETRLYIVLDTLEYLQRGGRIGKAQSLIGSLLSLKPILTVREGEIHPHEKVRTRAKALARLLEIASAGAPYRDVALVHETAPEEAFRLAERLGGLTDSPVVTGVVGPGIGTYSGPGAVGVALRK